MLGYDDIHTNVSESIKIMGIPFYAENIQSHEPFNRRETEFIPIIGGTERISSGKYIHREYSFTTTWFFPTGEPNAYDKIFREMMSKPVEVVSKYMGGTFKAMIVISRTFPENSPNHMDLEVTVTEVPDKKSKIPGEGSFTVPKIKKINSSVKNIKSNKTSVKSQKSTKNKSKKKSAKKKNK